MARLTDRAFSQQDADDFMARSNQPHTVKWKADVYRWVGGVENTLAEDLPIVGGTLSLDSSDPIRRHLTLEIGSTGEFVPDQPFDPLAPFGQVVKLWCTIDRADGTGWFPWLKQGEYPIVSSQAEWPSKILTIECADYAFIVDQYLHEKKKSYNKMTIRDAIEEIVKDALPDHEFFIQSPGAPHTVKCEAHTVAEAGTSRWETATSIASARGFDCFFNSRGNLVIRHSITNADNEVETIPGEGPDIGTVSHPVAVVKDGPGGNLVAITTAVTREGAINGVVINLHETVSQTLVARKKKEAADNEKEPDPDDKPDPPDDGGDDPEVPRVPNPAAGDARVNVAIRALGTGAIKWGDKFGRAPLVIEKNVKRINNTIVQAQKQHAKRLLNRRGGVIRSIDLDAVGVLWLEPDDKIRVVYDGRTEAHYVASVDITLDSSSPVRIRCRSLNVMDPG